eukprot:maker-scaffold459_size165548-snap-gene-0.26 protein:Tk05717 transcript:maker-scaffold459_size165548-snap-gene-0.26-mRNA-1 annotation:"carbonic anhydrase"
MKSYQFEEIYFHWGSGEDPEQAGHEGSEHAIDGYFFPAELQIFGFNSILFKNISDALRHPHGVVGVSVMVQESERTIRNGFGPITNHLKKVMYKGQNFPVSNVNLHELLPSTDDFMTYEGSLTFPGCWESVTWILMNKPIYVSPPELYALRQLQQGDKQQPKAPLAKNNRPIQDLNERSIRTNIIFSGGGAPRPVRVETVAARDRGKRTTPGGRNQEDNNIYGMKTFYPQPNERKRKKERPENNNKCPEVAKEMYYQANSWIKD